MTRDRSSGVSGQDEREKTQGPTDDILLAELESGHVRWIDLPKKYPGLTTRDMHARLIAKFGYQRVRAAADMSYLLAGVIGPDGRLAPGIHPLAARQRLAAWRAHRAAVDRAIQIVEPIVAQVESSLAPDGEPRP